MRFEDHYAALISHSANAQTLSLYLNGELKVTESYSTERRKLARSIHPVLSDYDLGRGVSFGTPYWSSHEATIDQAVAVRDSYTFPEEPVVNYPPLNKLSKN